MDAEAQEADACLDRQRPYLALCAKLSRLKMDSLEESPTARREAKAEFLRVTGLLAPLSGGRSSLPTTALGVVYFIKVSAFIKIGFTACLAKRIARLSTASPVAPVLLHQEPGRVEDERAYHRRFSAQHERLEWFRHEGELAVFLAAKAVDNGHG